MQYDQYVEYVTINGVFGVRITHHDLANPLVAETLKHAYEHVEQMGRKADLSAADVTGVKEALSAYHADVQALITQSLDPLAVVEQIAFTLTRPSWQVGVDVKLQDVVLYEPLKNLYRCVQAHKTQADWTPDRTPALWVKFFEASAGPQPWVQPAGAHDAYQIGTRVTYKGHLWECLTANNVWAPDVYGWKDLGVYP